MIIKSNSSYTKQHSFWLGVKGQIPITSGVIPFGLIFGVLGIASGMNSLQTMAMSSIVFAGSAQFIGAQLVGAGTPTVVIWFTTFIVNVRHVLYSSTLGSDLQHLPRAWRWGLAYLLTDEAFATTAVHYADKSIPIENKHFYFLGAGLTLWTVWQTCTAIGIFLGAEIPSSWSLDFTLALTFIGIVVPSLTTRPFLSAALTSGIIGVLTFNLPFKIGLMIAALSGIAVGYALEKREERI
ncbi:MAG: AzlC family ABC transporter permease [Chloroflexota bacterium]